MRTTININGKDVEITLTPEQVKQIKKSEYITERLKTDENILTELGEKDEEVVEYRLLVKAGAKERTVYQQLAVCLTKALNEGKEGNWNDSNDYKYFIWFYLDNNNFRSSVVSYNPSTTSPATLSFRKRSHAEYAAKQYLHIYKKFMC